MAAVYGAVRNVGGMFLPGINLMAFTCFKGESMSTFYLFIYSQDYMFFTRAGENSGKDFTHNTLCLDFVMMVLQFSLMRIGHKKISKYKKNSGKNLLWLRRQ